MCKLKQARAGHALMQKIYPVGTLVCSAVQTLHLNQVPDETESRSYPSTSYCGSQDTSHHPGTSLGIGCPPAAFLLKDHSVVQTSHVSVFQ